MECKTLLVFLFGVVFLCVVIKEAEAAGGFNITVPINRRILGAPAKKCVVYTWTGVCEDKNCTDKIKCTLMKIGDTLLVFTPAFRPYTEGDKQAVCFYNTSEAASCCESLMNGSASVESKKLSFGDFERIEFEITRRLYGQQISVSDTFLLPWKDPCQVNKPCGTYGACEATKPAKYNCTCNSGWQGINCKDYTGWVTMYDKCLKDATNVKTVASSMVYACGLQCKAMNKEKIVCKSFEFIPSSADPKTGECKLYDVSNKHDKKELETCVGGIYFDMMNLHGGAGSLITVSFSVVIINIALSILI